MLEKAHAAFANLMHSSFKLLKRNVYMQKPAPISQVVERPLREQEVKGSNPSRAIPRE